MLVNFSKFLHFLHVLSTVTIVSIFSFCKCIKDYDQSRIYLIIRSHRLSKVKHRSQYTYIITIVLI